jgi:hypothetical protein
MYEIGQIIVDRIKSWEYVASDVYVSFDYNYITEYLYFHPHNANWYEVYFLLDEWLH